MNLLREEPVVLIHGVLDNVDSDILVMLLQMLVFLRIFISLFLCDRLCLLTYQALRLTLVLFDIWQKADSPLSN